MAKILWTTENIRIGFDRYLLEHGHLPTALEIDSSNYLPSSRLIQKKFGGLETLRKKLGYKDTHFGKTTFRSNIAHRVNLRGRNTERALESILKKRFGEVFVHSEKIFDLTKNRVDFYVYSPNGNFGVDIFYSDTIHSLQSNVNIKFLKYRNFPALLFFVSANESINQEILDQYVNSRKSLLPLNIKLVCMNTFLKLLTKMKVYPDPLK